MTTTHLFVKSWAAISPGLNSREDWHAWTQGDKSISGAEFDSPKLPQLPAMLRRRLSPMGKTALTCAFQALGSSTAPVTEAKAPAMVFCSQHGEVGRTLAMLQDIAKQQPLSPTAFSLSVHNAIAGIYSMAQSHKGNITALAAGADGVCAALIEAAGLLNEGAEQALCVIYDQPLPDFYPATQQAEAAPLALAVLLGKTAHDSEQQISFNLQSRDVDAISSDPASINLAFIRFLLQRQDTKLNIIADQRHWHWFKQV